MSRTDWTRVDRATLRRRQGVGATLESNAYSKYKRACDLRQPGRDYRDEATVRFFPQGGAPDRARQRCRAHARRRPNHPVPARPEISEMRPSFGSCPGGVLLTVLANGAAPPPAAAQTTQSPPAPKSDVVDD